MTRRFEIRRLGPARVPSPLGLRRYMTDDVRVLRDPHLSVVEEAAREGREPESYEQAGPREHLFFDPSEVTCGILTAGGTSPGLNDVIRALFMELHHVYGVPRILGLRFGYDGLTPDGIGEAFELTPDLVEGIHRQGGTVLGTGRGSHDAAVLCDGLEELDLDVLFCIGGDGTLKGAAAMDEELRRRERRCAVVGLPKTIDNDIGHCSETFGFQTAVSEASRTIANAHVEALGHRNGVGLVQLMGRESGFIAAMAALATPDANFVLVPEVPFDFEGDHGLLAALRRRLEAKHHAVIVVAEGAAMHVFDESDARRDPSGNLKYPDVGRHLAKVIPKRFEEWGVPIQLKYFDPSYDIRSVPAAANDAILCGQLAKMAVHAALSGRTGLMIGTWNDMHVHVPLEDAVRDRKRLKPEGLQWQMVLATTGQPPLSRDG